jgi:gliding motility-associated lipoprotein GldH
MKLRYLFFLITLTVFSCDEQRIFEKNYDFDNRYWIASDKPEFDFDISDDQQAYNIYCNVRNSVAYPYSRLFVTYYVEDSLGKQVQKKLFDQMLFDPKTGKPSGTSGLGDIYDHQVPILTNYKFGYKGKHKIKLEQFMRRDTLQGVLAVGVRIEKVQARN